MWTPFSAHYNQFENEISAGYSEDSDYTSDLNYPVGQHANSSASQFRSAAHQIHTPQRSLETSRENSYERDDGPGHHHLSTAPITHHHHLSPGSHRQRHLNSTQQVNILSLKWHTDWHVLVLIIVILYRNNIWSV